MAARNKFQELAAAEEAARREAAAAEARKAEEKRKKEEQRKLAGDGKTKIGTTKGQIKAFATAFEAIAEGDDVEITVKEGSSGGWTQSNVTSDSRGKWEGGVRPATMEARRIVKDKPQGPPPKKTLT
jgi:sRNA-binding protein